MTELDTTLRTAEPAARSNTAQRYRTRLYGLDIESELELHSRRRGSATASDVSVQLGAQMTVPGEAAAGDLLAQWSTGDGLRATFVRTASGAHRLRFESTCEVVIDAECSTITVHMAIGVPDSMGSVLVAGTVFSFLLLLRGEPVLHASAVELDGSAFGFVGASGMGKTTLATLLCQVGGRLITDDVLRIDRTDNDGFGCYLGATELRLRQAASTLVHEFGDSGSHRVTADARNALSVPVSEVERAPLAALIVPRPRRDLDEVQLTRLSPRDAALGLLSFPRINGICDPRMLSRQFVQMTEIAEAVPVVIADVPWGPPFPDDLAQRLRERITTEIAPGD